MPKIHNLETEKLVCDLIVNEKLTNTEVLKRVPWVSKPYITRLIKRKNLREVRVQKYLTPEIEKEICNMYNNTGNNTGLRIAEYFKITPGTLYNVLRKHNIRLKLDNPTEEHQKEIINAYLNENLSMSDIAKKYNSSIHLIKNIIDKNNIEHRGYIITDKRDDWLKNSLIKCDENFFEKLDTPEKAWVAGFIAGDGHVTNGDNWQRQISITLQRKDLEVLEKIKTYMNSEHRIYSVQSVIQKTGNIFYGYDLAICRKKLWEDINKLGIDYNKSKKFTMPEMDEKFIPDFIRGINCSDGGFFIRETNQISFSIACSVYSFLEELRVILMEKCELNKVKIVSTGGCWHLRYIGNDKVRRIFDYLYYDPNSKIFLERKYNYAKKHFDNLDKGIRSRGCEDPPVSQFEESIENKSE